MAGVALLISAICMNATCIDNITETNSQQSINSDSVTSQLTTNSDVIHAFFDKSMLNKFIVYMNYIFVVDATNSIVLCPDITIFIISTDL